MEKKREKNWENTLTDKKTKQQTGDGIMYTYIMCLQEFPQIPVFVLGSLQLSADSASLNSVLDFYCKTFANNMELFGMARHCMFWLNFDTPYSVVVTHV